MVVPVTHKDSVDHRLIILDQWFDRGSVDVLPPAGDDDALLATSDRQHPIGAVGSEVAGVEPTVAQRVRGCVLVIEVPQKDAATFDQDLAIVGKRDFDAGHRMPNRSEPGRPLPGDR